MPGGRRSALSDPEEPWAVGTWPGGGGRWPGQSRASRHPPLPQSGGLQSERGAAALPAGVHSARSARPTLGIEELCQKREELCRQIQQEEEEKQRLQSEVRQLTERLARVNENLARKIASRNEFDRTIAETEAAYLKVGLGASQGPARRVAWGAHRQRQQCYNVVETAAG